MAHLSSVLASQISVLAKGQGPLVARKSPSRNPFSTPVLKKSVVDLDRRTLVLRGKSNPGV